MSANKSLAQVINKYGDKGSPCLIPRPGTKGHTSDPLAKTV